MFEFLSYLVIALFAAAFLSVAEYIKEENEENK